MASNKKYEAVCPVEYQTPQGEKKTKWVKCGTGYVTQKGSLMIFLDALPVNGKLVIRERQPYQPREGGGYAAPPSPPSPPPPQENTGFGGYGDNDDVAPF